MNSRLRRSMTRFADDEVIPSSGAQRRVVSEAGH
jgi:hypothetical protein